MTEILITSSVLILALLVLRRVFREKISRRAQYALWLLVLARLLIPVSLPTAGFGVLSAAEPAVEAASSRLESRAVYVLPLDRAPAAEVPAPSQAQPGQVGDAGHRKEHPAHAPAEVKGVAAHKQPRPPPATQRFPRLSAT